MPCNENNLITRIRRKVHDHIMTPQPDRPKYKDPFYKDAINDGLMRLCLDLCVDLTLATLTKKEEYAVEMAATIIMLNTRSGEGASTDVRDIPEGGTQMVNVPGLMVQNIPPQIEGTRAWAKLAAQYEALYNKALQGCISASGSGRITVGTMTRTSLRTGRLTHRTFSEPLPSVSPSAVVAALEVLLTWDKIIDTHFRSYIILRSVDSDLSDSTQIFMTSDNHKISFTDSPGLGTWYYLVRVTNDHELKSDSVIISAVVV